MKPKLLLLLFALFLSYWGWGQQVIGSFPNTDGGFENQSGTLTTASSISSVQTYWTTQVAAAGIISTTGGRSGPKYVTYTQSGSSHKRLQSPTSDIATGSYIVQFYYQGDLDGGTYGNIRGAVSCNGTSSPSYGTYITGANTGSNWTKYTAVVNPGTYAANIGIGVISVNNTAQFNIDDFVMYAGAADNTAPDSPGTVTISNATGTSLDVSWDAATGGVDGGGYVVVRYSSDPGAGNDPNQNGIYAIGNAVPTGGTVRYIGTSTSFTDNVDIVAATQYWYKVFTVDKAFNYSTESSASGTTSGGGAITKLVITSVNGGNSPSANTPFSVVVEGRDASDNPAVAASDIDITLSLNTGTGSLGGVLTGTISTGNGSTTISGVTYNTAENGVVITAGAAGLTSGNSSSFNVLDAANHLVVLSFPIHGRVNTNISAFTVEARRADNSVDANFTSNIIISKNSGAGTLSGTLSKAASAGISTFNDIQFDIAGIYSVNANSGLLTQGTSTDIDIFVPTSFRTKSSGTWNVAATWEETDGTNWYDALDYPKDATTNATIQNGHTILLTDNLGKCKDLNVNNGGKLWANSTTSGKYLYVYGNITNDGIIGTDVGATTKDLLGFDIEGTNCNISGSGIFDCGRMSKFTTDNLTTNVVINMDVALRYVSGTASALYNGAGTTTTFNITVNAGKKLEVPNAKIDLNYCTLTLKSNAAGTATLLDNGTINGQSGTNVVAEQFLSSNKWHFMTPPLTGNTALVFSTTNPAISGNIYLRTFNEPANNYTYIVDPTTVLNVCQGYQLWATADNTAIFTGTLSTSDITLNTASTPALSFTNSDPYGFNLVGNPFMSAIDGDLLTKTNIDASVYVWDGTAGNYKGWNGTIGGLTDGIIPAMQGFFVHANAANPELVIPTASRLYSSTNFYKEAVYDLLSLKVTGAGYEDATYINLNNSATIGFDNQYDAYKLMGSDEAPQLYTTNSEQNFSINVLPYSANEIIVPMSFKAGVNTDYTLSVKELYFDPSITILLEDVLAGQTLDLRQNNTYTFAAQTGDDVARFKVHILGATGIQNPGSSNPFNIYAFGNTIYVNNQSAQPCQTEVYTVSGQLVASKILKASSLSSINSITQRGVYVVKVTSAGKTLSEKVVLK
ncbi:MAG: T9SS type A sorting domain-containing protein [Lentimicrobiaceae bacterium]|nr:T9SS type A sorting domain-containing protein [Lentimicrobiaceae bacterium]